MEVLRRAILSVQDYSDQVGEERKKMFGNNQMSKSRYRGGRSYAEVVAEDGIRSGVPLSAGKWARVVICECKEKVQDWTDEGKAIARLLGVKAGRAKWLQEQERLLVKGRLVLLRRWLPRENMFIPGKFRRGWLVLKGLPFHLWEEDQLKFILKKWGKVTEVAREAVKLLDLTKVKLWVEMHPNVVLLALLEVEDGAWKHTVAVSVIGEEGEDGNVTSETSHCKYEWLKEGGCVSQTPKFAEGLRGSIRGNECYRREPLPRARYRRSSTSMAPKGRMDGKGADWAYERGSSAKVTTQPRSGDERAGVEVILGEDGRADEFQAQTSSNPSPPSEIEEESYGRRTVGCKSSGPLGLGQVQGGSMSSGLRYGSRERESAARKGKAPMDQMEDFTQGEKTMDSREMWSKLFLPSADRRHGQRSSSETLPLRSAASLCEGRNLEVDGRMGSQQTRGIRESPIFRCLLPRKCNSWSKEETSTSRGVMESRKSQLKEDKGGFTGRAGYDPCSSSVTVSPSIPRTRGDVGPLNFVGIPVHVEEENQRAVFNQMSERSTPGKSSNLMPGSPGVNEASPPEDFLIDGLSPRKMAKVREVLCSLDIKVYSRRKNRALSPRHSRKPLSEGPRIIGQLLWDTNPFMWGPTPFRFENMWLQHPSFKENFRKLVEGVFKETDGKATMANGRRNRKYIKSLENERGLVLNNAESITEEILLYFEKLYANPIGESWSIEGLDWSPISEESAISLVAPFTEEEISKAIFQMDRDKAPGPDGFTIAVFQDCWDVIKEDLVRVFAEFHRSGVINQSTNASFIVLLPKKSTTKKISDFRPISLITSLYKIIAKVLSRRLRGVLHETIHSTQGAFVQGRQIMDANQVLEKKGFSPKWRKWMNGCLSSVSYAILVNGSAKGWDAFESRGEKYVGRVSGWVETELRVSHLQFADDTIFFSNTREEDLQTLKSLLLAFGHISGLKVNLDKSNIYGINLDQAHISRLAETLECKASGWPILYLGLPLGGNPRAGGFWDPVIREFQED
ncbi:Transposon TX1 uncharacterized 149 kDa protein [Vitis vinifera]|uniref:Transposon TX1 uncharacterized 149 kDa protein n=1 Tax=Vitis vinifera TaxID=29760 RepID=A0A438HLI2_VITVI|nr:Transposon TX1 uncharacterized 149 kDa protein [Vitis vinifera]